jgi:N-acetylmuramoyl-L-alanine amidase
VLPIKRFSEFTWQTTRQIESLRGLINVSGILAGGIAGVLVMAQSTWAASLDYWRFNATQSRLDFVTEDSVRPNIRLIGNPTRLVVDLPGIRLGRPRSSKTISQFVEQVRIGQLNRGTARLVIELNNRYTVDPREISVKGLAPNRWSVQLPELQPLDQQSPLPQAGLPINVPAATPYPRARVVVAVDPGHGGGDVGAVGRGGIREAPIVLDISLRMARYLEARGVQAVLTRRDDREIDLAPRVAIAERARVRAFVSVHANALSMSAPGVNGLETYYYSSGLRLAQVIHATILGRLPMVDRGIRRARFYVLRNTSMPAVLVETGYVTGSQDARNLANPTFRARMAEAISEGVLKYFR